MQIGLFEVVNDVLIPDEIAVRLLPWMRQIEEKFPNNYQQIYAYLFYMSCWDSRNIYINRLEEERESAIVEDFHIDFSLDDPLIIVALEKCRKLYTTPAVAAYKSIRSQIEKLNNFLETTTPISEGKNSNITDIGLILNKLADWTEAYDRMGERLKKEQAKVRGGKKIAIDQLDQLL